MGLLRPSQVRGMGALTAFPASGFMPGDILLGETGAIDNTIAFVLADNTLYTPDLTPYVPANDNLTDLGDATHRFRTLYLGTGIDNPGVGTTTLSIGNSTASQVCNVTVDGSLTAATLSATTDDGNNATYTTLATLTKTTTGAPAQGIGGRILYGVEGAAGIVAAGAVGGQLSVVTGAAEVGVVELAPAFAGSVAPAGLRTVALSTASLLVNGAEVRPITAAAAATTGVIFVPYGATANCSIGLTAGGTGNVLLDGGATGGVLVGVNASAKVGFFATPPIARKGTIANPTDLASCIVAITAILDAMRPAAGYGLIAP